MEVFTTPAEKLLPLMVRVLYYGLKTIGLAPFSIQFRTLTRNYRNTCIKVVLFSRIGLLYNLILAILIQIIGVLGISSATSMEYENKSSVNKALDLVLYTLSIATSSFIVIYLAFVQKKAAIIMNRLLDIQFLLSGVGGQSFNKRSYIFLSLQMVFHVFLWASAISTDLFINPSSTLVACNSISVIIYFFLIEYSIILRLIVRELEILNQNLSNLNDFPSYLFRTSLPPERLATLSSTTRSQLATLKLLHSIRTTLFELSQDIADLFSLPMLIAVTCIFVSLVETFYFLILLISMPISGYSIMISIDRATWFLKSVLPLISVAFNVTDIAKKASLTGRIVHKLLATAKDQEIIKELEHFSLHLAHEDVSFTAHGFFTLDFTLLQSIFGATATYLVVVLQFVQSANDHHRSNYKLDSNIPM